MQIPSKIVDLSMPLDNETVCDPDIMRPKIDYVSQQENAEAMAGFFEGMKPSDLPNAEGCDARDAAGGCPGPRQRRYPGRG